MAGFSSYKKDEKFQQFLVLFLSVDIFNFILLYRKHRVISAFWLFFWYAPKSSNKRCSIQRRLLPVNRFITVPSVLVRAVYRNALYPRLSVGRDRALIVVRLGVGAHFF